MPTDPTAASVGATAASTETHECADCYVISAHCRLVGTVWLCDPCWRTWKRMEQFHAHLD